MAIPISYPRLVFAARFVDSVRQYLRGDVDHIPENGNPLPDDVADLFYLLGDYYFKNKIMVSHFLFDAILPVFFCSMYCTFPLDWHASYQRLRVHLKR